MLAQGTLRLPRDWPGNLRQHPATPRAEVPGFLSGPGEGSEESIAVDIHGKLLQNRYLLQGQSPGVLVIVCNPHAINDLVLSPIFRPLELSDTIC